MKDSLCLVTGGFDPLHSGHLEYFKATKKISEYLVVGVNSDNWLKMKKITYSCPGLKDRRSLNL